MSENHEHCLKESDIATVKAEVSDLKKIVKGNGQKGLQQAVHELNVVVPQLTEAVDGLNKNVRLLLEKDIAASTERAVKMSAKQKLGAIITAIIGAATVIVMIADMIIKR